MTDDVIERWRAAMHFWEIDDVDDTSSITDAFSAGDALCAELEKCRAKLAAVEALAEKWESEPMMLWSYDESVQECAVELRETLKSSSPDSESPQQE